MHIFEDYFLPEIIDPNSTETLADDVTGELVLTNLNKEGMPLLRYRTRDLTSISHDVCDCGRTTARLSRFKGRSDDMLIIRGVNVFPSQIETALLSLDETTPNYQIIVDRVGSLDNLTVKVEVDEKFFSDEIRELEKLEKKIAYAIQQMIGLATKVKLVEPRSIERSEGKAKRVIDNRKFD
ncbi:MAG: phenylacetate--CoA ligase, partial [Lachnospiraceae bacterium]|nr:phenylacetate--CoA ligase [Lachnospiraceae bacterium]